MTIAEKLGHVVLEYHHDILHGERGIFADE